MTRFAGHETPQQVGGPVTGSRDRRQSAFPDQRCADTDHMSPKQAPLPFDPIDEAARQWGRRWDRVPAMHAVTSLMRVQQLVIGRLDGILKPHGLTFARYEALVLLVFSSRGSLPLGKMGERLQVHPTSVTSIVRRLVDDGLVVRVPHPDDGRGVLAEITPRGREVVEVATLDLVATDFALEALSDEMLGQLSTLLTPVRRAAGDFAP